MGSAATSACRLVNHSRNVLLEFNDTYRILSAFKVEEPRDSVTGLLLLQYSVPGAPKAPEGTQSLSRAVSPLGFQEQQILSGQIHSPNEGNYTLYSDCTLGQSNHLSSLWGWQDGSVGKGACCQARDLEFNPWDSRGGRKELALISCTVTYTHTHTNI